MSTFTEIYYNGNEYKQMWLNGTKIWEKASGEVVVLPYPQYDIYGTIRVCNNYSSSDTYQLNFDVIDSSLPYSINGIETSSYETPTISKNSYKDITLGLKNLYPRFNVSGGNVGSGWIKFEQFYLPKNVTSMYYCFRTTFSTYNGNGYFTFPTKYSYATNPTFPYLDTSNITNMSYCFYMGLPSRDGIYQYRPTTFDLSSWNTSKTTTMRSMFYGQSALTTLNVDGWDVSNVTDMAYMFNDCSSLTSLDLSSWHTSNLTTTDWMFVNCSALKEIHLDNFDTRNVTSYSIMFNGITDCTIYIGDNWTLDTSSTAYGGTNLTFARLVPITSITLESTLTDTTIAKGTQFTITPTITPTDYSGDELVITYDENYLSMVDNTFTVLDTATVGQQLDITYSSKKNPSVSATYSVTIRDFVPITSISLTHTLESLTDVAIGTTFTVVPTVEPTTHEDELLIDYDTNQLSKDGDSYTVLDGASGQTVQVIYYSKHDNNVNVMLEFTVEEKAVIVYPYPDADCVITYRNTSSYSPYPDTKTFAIIDSSLPYSINGNSTNSYTFPYGETKVKLINLKPTTSINGAFFPTNIEQLRLPNLTDLSNLFYDFYANSDYTYSWSPQYFEFHPNPTNMSNMFYNCKITNDTMAQFMPYFPNTSSVTDMNNMFYNCNKLTSLDLSNFDTSNVSDMSYMFNGCNLTSLDVSNFNTGKVTNMEYMFYYCDELTSLDISSFDTSNVTNMKYMFGYCKKLTSLDLSNFNTSKVTSMSYMFSGVFNCTIYIGENWTLDTSSTAYGGENLTFIEKIILIESIQLSHDIEDISNVAQESFVITPSILPTNYGRSDLEIIYDSTYMIVNPETNEVKLKNGCQGKTLSITYRSKADNSINNTLTFTVSQDFEIPTLIDFTTSTAPTLPSCMTLDGQGSYYFSHGNYSDVYGLVPNNSGKHSTVAYTRYKFVAPKNGALTFTYRCFAETNYDYLTVHVNTSTSQPSYSSSTNQVLTTYGVSSYQTTDGTASVNVASGTTYYIHIQYRKDGSSNVGYDKGCIRKIELI